MAYTDIDKPSDYFNPVTWTGTGDPTTSVTGVNFQPDFVWIKNRSVADDHMLFDAVVFEANQFHETIRFPAFPPVPL